MINTYRGIALQEKVKFMNARIGFYWGFFWTVAMATGLK